MTDFQACTDDHVVTSSSVTSACYICRSCLSSPKGRRTLDSVSEQNRKAVSFIERFVTEVPISTQQLIRLYLCKLCFSRVDKARRAAKEAEKTINSLRVLRCLQILLQGEVEDESGYAHSAPYVVEHKR